MRRSGRGVLAALVVGLVGAADALPAGAELRDVQTVGAAPLRGDRRTPPRDAAVRAALANAVQQVALELLPGIAPDEADGVFGEVLGDEPFDYVVRFRIAEDRGERRALFSADVETEYVVVVEAQIDVDRIRQRLTGSGLLDAPSGEGRGVRVEVVLVDLEDYAGYLAVRRILLEGLRVRSAVPISMQRGRAVIAVESNREPGDLLRSLSKAAPEGVQITPVGTQDMALFLRVHVAPSGGPPGSAPAEIDTQGRNRY